MKIHFFLTLSILLLTAPVHAQHKLTVTFEGMAQHLGQSFHIRVSDKTSDTEVGRQVIPELVDSTFSIDLYVLLEKRNYTIDFFVDQNGNDMYDAPPVDHAWQLAVSNATQNTNVLFKRDDNFADIAFPALPDLSTYAAVWGGKWMNLTFGSTDSIRSAIQFDCDSFHYSATTSGIFGNPDTVTFAGWDTLPSLANANPSDTFRIVPPAPWTGSIVLTNGKLFGLIELTGTNFALDFIGTAGLTQMLAHYEVLVNGAFFANGYFYNRELEVLSRFPALTIEEINLTHLTCYGDSSGAASVKAQGGRPAYSYDWSDGGTGGNRAQLSAGNYSVSVTDLNGCSISNSFIIDQPDSISLTVTHTDETSGQSNGTIEVDVFGGLPPYNFNWLKDDIFFSDEEDLSGLEMGVYCVEVSDTHRCLLKSSDIEVDNITSIQDFIRMISIYPNPVHNYLHVHAGQPVEVILKDMSGIPLLHLPLNAHHKIDVANRFMPGMYILEVIGNGNKVSRKIIFQ